MKAEKSGNSIISGRKDDQGKLRYDLLDPQPIEDLVRVLTAGAAKYGDSNWKQVENAENRYYAAMLRHVQAWRQGEKQDKEDGLPHLAHAMCCLMFLMWIEEEREKEKVVLTKDNGPDRVYLCYILLSDPEYGLRIVKKVRGHLLKQWITDPLLNGCHKKGLVPLILDSYSPGNREGNIQWCDKFFIIGDHITDRMEEEINLAKKYNKQIIQWPIDLARTQVQEDDHKRHILKETEYEIRN